MKSLTLFHNKVLRGSLNLRSSSPIPALHFLLGELPIEALLHMRTLGLFHNIWINGSSTIHTMGKYILTMCRENSTTWFHHIRLLCLKYGLPDPLSLLHSSEVWAKEKWSVLVKTRVTAWHERNLRKKAQQNSKMRYLHVGLIGLTGRPHPALWQIMNTQDARKSRTHLQMLVGDFGPVSTQPNGAVPQCGLCSAPAPDIIEHTLTLCKVTVNVKARLLPELLNLVASLVPYSQILCQSNHLNSRILSQFILDCTSFNLPANIRVPFQHPEAVTAIFNLTRNWCYAVSKLTKPCNATA